MKRIGNKCIFKLPTWYLSPGWDGDRFAGRFEIRTNYIEVIKED